MQVGISTLGSQLILKSDKKRRGLLSWIPIRKSGPAPSFETAFISGSTYLLGIASMGPWGS